MDAGRRDPDELITGLYVIARDNILLIRDTNGKSRQIVFIFGIESGHLGRLSADQRRAGLDAALAYAADDLGDLFRHIFAAGNIIQEKERFAAGARDVIDAHCDAVDADSVVPVH